MGRQCGHKCLLEKKLSNSQIYILNSRFLFSYYKLYGNLVKCLLSFLYFLSNVEECVLIAKKYIPFSKFTC